jgi:predicted Fe-Mo cluster-binding NifX family protein
LFFCLSPDALRFIRPTPNLTGKDAKGGEKMKIAFTTSGNELTDPLDARFGRAAKFLIYDLEGQTFEVVDNQQNLNAAQGAGIQSAGTVARAGVQALVSGHCGPKAFQVLQAAHIKIFYSEAATVAEALDAYRQGKLVESKTADVAGHW